MRAPTLAATATATVLVLTSACGSSEQPATPPARDRGPFGTVATPSEPPAAPGTRPGRRSRTPDPFGHGDLDPVGEPGPFTITDRVEVPGDPPRPAERDLSADLVSAVGAPTACIDLAAARAARGHLSIRITATVMPTGAITRASASGAGLSPQAISCIEARALSARLAAPVEGAPRSVSGTIEVDVATTEDTTETTTPEIPTPPGAVAPGIVTPAIGPSGPVEGSVTPSSTLPATGPDGRPEGTVAPDILLPARAP